jgi:hypothetical protein
MLRRALVVTFSCGLAAACVDLVGLAGAPSDGASSDGGDTGALVDASMDRPLDAPTLDAGSDARFCAQYPTAIVCDDFEEDNGDILSVWTKTFDGGTIHAALAPMRGGHAAKVAAAGDGAIAMLSFAFPPSAAVAGVVFDLDILIDTPGYNYIELAELEVTNFGIVYYGGLAQGGSRLGRHFTPFSGPSIPVDMAWHHLDVDLQKSDGGDGGFAQTVTIDSTVLEQTSSDLPDAGVAIARFGVIASVATPNPPLTVIYIDNVLIRPQ